MLSVSDCAKKLGVTDRRVRALISAGKIDAKKFGATWIVLDYSRAKKRKVGRPVAEGVDIVEKVRRKRNPGKKRHKK